MPATLPRADHAYLGMETQRQGSDPAIFRATPPLLGLYSVVTLYVQQAERLALSPRRAAWHPKSASGHAITSGSSVSQPPT